MLERCTVATFQPYVGTTFLVTVQDATAIELRLIEAEPTGTDRVASSSEGRIPFSLLFRGPAEVTLEQLTHHLEHESLGSLDIFLVPIHPDDEGPLYEAVFT
jgi:hypothetical protein